MRLCRGALDPSPQTRSSLLHDVFTLRQLNFWCTRRTAFCEELQCRVLTLCCRKQLRKTVAAVAKDAGKAAKAAAALQAAAAREGGPDTASCTGVARYLMSYSEGLAGYLAAVQAEGEGGGGDGGKGSGREKEGKGRGREKEGKGKRSGGKGSGKGRGAEDGAEAGSGKAKRAKTKA